MSNIENICDKCPVAKICQDAGVLPQQPENIDSGQSINVSVVAQGLNGLNNLSLQGRWGDWGMCGLRDSHG